MKKIIIFVITLIIVFLISLLFFYRGNEDIGEEIIPEEEIKIITNNIEEEDSERIISVFYPSLGIEEIDREIKEYIDSEIKEFKALKYISFVNEKYFLDIDYFYSAMNKNIVSFKFSKSDYTGGAHGNQYVKCFTYNLKEKKRLDLDDFFKDASYLEKISSITVNDFMQEEYADENWIKEGAGPKKENYERFIVSENAFVFYFPPYQVAPYALGEKQMVIPFNNLSDYLNDSIFKNYDFSVNKGIYILTPKSGEKIGLSSIVQGDLKYFLRVEGYLNGNGWAPFEAVGGKIELVDDKNNILATSQILIPGNWMKIPVYFMNYLFFDPKDSKTGTLIFYNDNASGLEENNRKFSIPLEFKN
ncbi:MAG TPA: DUF3298 domain-containing protein [Candidatus Pacearchaeota archaeon]|nr:DUF3298 domain-containing protein [Candidatus Pacearchaeota archaeon]